MTVRSRLLSSLAAGLVLALLAVLFRPGGGSQAPSAPWTFEIELRASAGSFAQLFWTPEINFVEEQSARMPIQAGGPIETLRFHVPQGVRWLRLDPTDAAAEVLIGRMTLRDSGGRTLTTFTIDSLTAGHQVASIAPADGGTRLVTSDADPWVILAVGCLPDQSSAEGRTRFASRSLALAAVTTIVFLAACLFAIGLDVVRVARAQGSPLAAGRYTWMWLPVVFLLVFSAKLLLIREFSVTAPTWDQWDAEARALYLPYYTCGLTWSGMFGLHNEHRIFFTRLLALGLLVLNGQWDPRLQQVVNAAMHAMTAVVLLVMLWRGLEWRLDVLTAIVVPVFGLPYAWENALLGFQSAFYFFLLFSIVGLWMTTAFRAGSLAWWLGWVCTLCGLFTAAGGIVLPAVIGFVAVLRMMAPGRRWRELALTVGVVAAVVAVGVAIMSPPLAHHAPLKAQSLRAFLSSVSRNLAWPWVDAPAAALLMWSPMAALAGFVASRRGRTSMMDRFLLGLAAWVILQAVAIAYGRGGTGTVPAPRYQDFLSLGFLANALALVSLALQGIPGILGRRFAIVAMTGWIAFGLAGLDRLFTDTLATLSVWRRHWIAQSVNVRSFVLTGDVNVLNSKDPFDIGYPSSDALADVLRQPIIRRILPAAVREPLHVEPRVTGDHAFGAYGAEPSTPSNPSARGWGTFTSSGNATVGSFESHHIAPCKAGGRLGMPVAGYLRLPGLSLELREVATGRSTEIRPPRLAREDWLQVTVQCPPTPFVIVGSDQRSDFWFAFREPSETGWLSVRAEDVISASVKWVLAALALLFVALRRT
jgi:hypothetical protein